MNNRRKLIVAVGASALAAQLPAVAQQPSKVWRVGFLTARLGIESPEEAFRQGLRELGYVEGKNLVLEWRSTKGDNALYPGLAAELVRLKLDCIVVNGVDAAIAARRASDTIPIVMANVSDDPVRLGLVASLAQPGGNITGLVSISEELAGKRVQLLKETVLKASRIGVLWDENSHGASGALKEIELAARALGVRIQRLPIRKREALESAFRAASKERADALIVVSLGMMYSLRPQIAELAVKSRLPAIYDHRLYVLAGGLMSYGRNPDEQYRRAASYVDKIFKGAKAGDLPIERPTKFEFVINLKAAKQIGLTIPPNVLARADKVIE